MTVLLLFETPGFRIDSERRWVGEGVGGEGGGEGHKTHANKIDQLISKLIKKY